MRECEYYQELMSRLLDGDLTEQEEQELRRHVRTCPDCQRLGAALTGLTDALRAEELVQPPPELAQKVMDRIGALDAPPRRRKVGRDRSAEKPAGRSVRPWVRLAAAACLVLIAGGAATFALRSARQRAAETETAELAAEQRALEAVPAPADAQPAQAGDVPMTISEPAPAADAALEGIQMSEDGAPAPADGAMAVSAEASPSPSPIQQPLPVYDAARTRIGTIAVENIPAFLRLITDAGWGTDGPPAEAPAYLLKVQYLNRTYDFATDGEGGLVWWEEPSTDPLRSPGTYQDLHDLIATEAPALPQ